VTHSGNKRRRNLLFCALTALAFPLAVAAGLQAQGAATKLEGTILDAQGGTVTSATVTATNAASGATQTTHTDSAGHYEFDGLAAGTYTIESSAAGFANNAKTGVVLAAGQDLHTGFTLSVQTMVQEVTVNAGIDSVAAQTAPSGGFIEERSAQSLISSSYIRNFTSPVADFGELVQIVPGAFTTSTDGVGLGQSKTYFRGFQDGDYDIDFDGIPFYDTNTPTHHSWAFFPAQWIGGVDFDRSPGTASTIGPTPFCGSIHLLSEPLSSQMSIAATGSYGTWNTELYEGTFNSGNFGLFGGAPKSNVWVDVHHMTSNGYQTFNYNQRDAGAILYQYTFSPKTVLTGFSGVIHLYADTPNISSTRCALYGLSAAYSCSVASLYVNGSGTPTTINQPYTGAGDKFLLTNNADPVSWFDYKYNHYTVPTDFEYIGFKTEFSHGWYMDVKPYTYNYDNGEKYSNAVPITDASTLNTTTVPGSVEASTTATGTQSLYYDGVAVKPCNVQVDKKGIYALPCGIDKYNSYRKYGETLLATQTSHLGILRAGLWYEWARTNRHQYPSDPLNNWADQALPKFNERFWTNSYQPYAEYEFHVTPKLNITAGTKFAAYTIDVLHFADDGSTVGELTCTSPTAACPATISNHGTFTAWLPSLDANYRILSNWSVYGQVSTGSVVPPSSVYDYNQTAASASSVVPTLNTPPKQQRSTTYQIGSVYKGNRITFDADAYHIRFQNSYASVTDNTGDVDEGDPIYYLQPSSITKGVEFETNLVLVTGLNLYLNGTAGNAYYTGSVNAGTQSSPYIEKVPSDLWVAQAPSDTEAEGLTYQAHGFDLGIFNKRIGNERVDASGASAPDGGGAILYHNQAIIAPFNTLNGYFNYTIQNHSWFDQTKIRLSGTNLLDSHNIQSLTLAGTATAPNISGTSYPDQFIATTPINGSDTPSLMAGRSFSVTVTFGFSPKGR
jgi:iron complex outermembrane receptor protein